jgi:hypothetical protein
MKLICEYCKTEYTKPLSVAINSKFCCRKCKDLSQVGKTGNRPKKRMISVCKTCGENFEHWEGRSAKYCSRNCWNKRNPNVLRECLLCGKEFFTYKSVNKLYCSNKCYNIHQRDIMKNENSPFWKGGITKQNKLDRTRAEYREWRESVFVRDNYTCQKCGKKNGNGYRVYLQAHHKEKWSDNKEKRFDIDNGITLCKDCHLLEHTHKF